MDIYFTQQRTKTSFEKSTQQSKIPQKGTPKSKFTQKGFKKLIFLKKVNSLNKRFYFIFFFKKIWGVGVHYKIFHLLKKGPAYRRQRIS